MIAYIYACLASVRVERSLCCGSLTTTYLIYTYIHRQLWAEIT